MLFLILKVLIKIKMMVINIGIRIYKIKRYKVGISQLLYIALRIKNNNTIVWGFAIKYKENHNINELNIKTIIII